MPVLIANNAVSRLASSIESTSNQIALSAGEGTRFPTPVSGQWFPLTLINAAGTLEIVRVTARSGDLLTVVRGQEGTQPAAFAAGDRAELRLTAATFASKLDADDGVISIPLTVRGDVTLSRPASPATGALFFGNAGTNYLYFDGTNYQLSGGQLAIGGSTAWHAGNFSPAAYMPLAGGNFTGNFGIYNTSPTVMFYDTDWGPRQLHCNGGLIGFLTSGGGWGCYSQNDGTFIASGNIGAYSDEKHKAGIHKIEEALDLVERLRGVRYIDRRTGAHRVGVVAQEVREHLPEVVGEGPDGLHVDYGNIVGVLIEGMKELSARVRALEAI